MVSPTTLTPNERDYQRAVINYAEMRSWSWWHFADSRRQVGHRLVGDRGAAGFPDLVLAHSLHGIVFAELKAAKGRLSDAQRRSLDALASATTAAPRGVLVHVWRPSDFDDTVRPVLDGKWKGPRTHGF